MIAKERNVIVFLTALVLAACLGFTQQAFASNAALVAGSYADGQPAQAMDLPGGKVVDGSSYHTGIIKSDGSLWMWGKNDSGQVGNGTTEYVEAPVKVMDDVSYALVSGFTSAAIKSDGSLWMWGSNGYGQLGDGTTTSRHEPVKVMDDVVSVYANGSISGATKSDGSFWIWGQNNDKQLGAYGMLGCGIADDWSGPVKAFDNIATAAIGTIVGVVTVDGDLYTWGYNRYGAVGDGTYVNKDTPTKVMSGVASLQSWNGQTFILKTDKSLWYCGLRDMSQTKKTPVLVKDDVVSYSVGARVAVMVTSDGSAWKFGNGAPVKYMDDASAARAMLYDNIVYILKQDGSLWRNASKAMDGVTSFGYSDVYGSGSTKKCVVSKSDGSFWEVEYVGDTPSSEKLVAQSDVRSVSVSASGPGSVSGPSRVFDGQYATVSAQPDEHAEFRGWYVDGVLASTEPTCSIKVTSDMSITGAFKIVYDLADAEIEGISDVSYTGSAIEPKPVVKVYGDALVEGVDYRLEYERNRDVGEARLSVVGVDADCRGRAVRTFKIVAAAVSEVRISQGRYVYSGDACVPDVVSVKAGPYDLGRGDYSVEYANNVNAGTAKVEVRGTGNYGGAVTVEYAIDPIDLGDAKVVLSKSAYTYSGKPNCPAVKAIGGMKLVQGRDFKLDYKNNKKAGTATATVVGAGNYAGESSATFAIRPMSLPKAVKKASLAYGKEVQFKGDRSKDVPAVSIPGLKRNRDFTVTSGNNKKIGKATAVIAGKGNYSGKLKRAFKLVVADGSVTTARSPKYGTITVRAAANAATKKHQFIVCTAKSADSAVRNATVSARTCRFSSLQLGKTYYVAERAVAKAGGKASYGEWSNWRAVKVESHRFVGSWDLVSYTFDGTTYGPDVIDRARAAGIQSRLKVRGDYTMTLTVGDSSTSYLWIPTSESGGMLGELDSGISMSCANGRLTMREGSAKMVFERN